MRRARSGSRCGDWSRLPSHGAAAEDDRFQGGLGYGCLRKCHYAEGRGRPWPQTNNEDHGASRPWRNRRGGLLGGHEIPAEHRVPNPSCNERGPLGNGCTRWHGHHFPGRPGHHEPRGPNGAKLSSSLDRAGCTEQSDPESWAFAQPERNCSSRNNLPNSPSAHCASGKTDPRAGSISRCQPKRTVSMRKREKIQEMLWRQRSPEAR
jgi:hypothetical protein